MDTHGLPVEIEVQKRLDLMSNEQIEALECKHSTMRAEKACGHTKKHGER